MRRSSLRLLKTKPFLFGKGWEQPSQSDRSAKGKHYSLGGNEEVMLSRCYSVNFERVRK